MVICKCIEKVRDKNNVIVEYRLCDSNNMCLTIKPNQLKTAMKSNQIKVTNLKLTEDNRLIDNKQASTNKTAVAEATHIVVPELYNVFKYSFTPFFKGISL